MKNQILQTLLKATARILRPQIKILLRYGVSYSAFSDLAKQVYFEVAKSEFAIPGKRQTASRISTMTGLSRKEVAKLEALPVSESLDASGINRAARVISGWVRDPEFHDAQGKPADLAFEGDRASFSALVKRYSGDITARTIADELTRSNAISVANSGLIHLQTHAYIPNTNVVDKLTILGLDVSDLIATIDHNLINEENTHYQRKVAYNYIPLDKLVELKPQLSKIAQTGLESMDSLLAKNAIKKASAKKGGNYARVGVGVYYFESEQI